MNCEVRPSPMSPHSRDSLEQAFVYILAERCRENAIRRQVYNSLIFLLIYHDNSFYVESGVGGLQILGKVNPRNCIEISEDPVIFLFC